ncbi:pitrilysin family protein [Hymenobacter sp. GOD-10R]|uniref:M16 family metallopeptidase n=1 Tax=Hymenobacter sp. GOD-10R TaxID=3093922 RepID=UPI002D796204|nr:pitrilysin family protein [Hymenobacter sp. GOD-10R]WRQ26324.1 pitrilysin family protein [Hymenobacter sp. GOD-10R]
MQSFIASIRPWCLASLLLTASLSSVHAQGQLSAGATKVTSVEGITEYQLSNGLRVLLFPDASKPTMTVNITYLVGSRHEGYGETGMAHLLEHMVFKGSTNHKNITQELTEHGARPNGTTWYDRTNYFETFAATDENLNWALSLEADRMVNSFISKTDLATEFSVVRNEFEMGENSPQGVLMERVLSSAYLWHNYGKSTIGSKEDIERVPIDNLQAFYKRFYQPDNAVLVVAGKIDEPKTLKLISQYFGAIPKPTRQLSASYTTEPTQDGERSVALRRVGDTQGLAVAYHTPAGAHPDYATLDVLMDVLTNEPSGRLYKALVDKKKVAYTYGWTPALHDPGFAFFYAEVRKEQSLDSARTAMLGTLDAVTRQAPTPEEVERAKTKLLSGIEMMFKNTERVGLDLSEWIAAGDWRLVFLYRDNIRKVKPADVQRVAGAYLKPSNRTVGVFIPDQKPDRAEIPATPDVAALVKNYKGEKIVAAGEAFDVSPANIEARTKRGQEKDIKYATLAKSTRGNSVNVQLTLRYGDEKSLTNKPVVASMTASMLERGTKTRSYQQIRDELDKLKSRAYVYGGTQTASVTVETAKENLPAVMKVVTDYLKNPSFPEAEFNKLREERLAGLEAQKQEPQAIAFSTSQRLLNPYPKGHPLYVMTFDEEIEALKALTLNEVKQFYKDFYGADNAALAVVGASDEATVRTLVKNDLAKWKASKPYTRIARTYQDVKPGSQALQTTDKANAVYVAGLNLPMRDDDPDYPALVLGNYLFGGGFLNSRLATRVRQKEGISYGIGSTVGADPRDKLASYTIYAIYNPENKDRLNKAIQEEFARMAKEGFSADEVKAAKSGYLQNRAVSRAQDNVLSGRLNTYLDLNRTFAWDADFEKKMQALTPEQVNNAVKKYLDYNKLVFVEAGDYEKAAKKKTEPKTAEPASYQATAPKKP